MPLDASIYAQQRPFRMDDPMKGVGEMLQLRQAQRQFSIEDDINAAGQESGGDPEKMAQALMKRGRYEPALKLKGQADTQKREEVAQRLKLAEAAGSDSIALDTLWRQALQESGGNRDAALQRVQPIYQQVNSKWAQMGFAGPDTFDPDANFANIGQAKEISAHLKSLAPDIVMTDTGGSMTPVNRNPLAGPVGPYAGSQSIPKTAAPAQPPSAVKEYEYAKEQGFKGTFQQFQIEQRNAGATKVNINEKAPPGYRWTEGGDLEPIPGGPATKLGEGQVKQEVGVRNTRDAIKVYRDALKNWGGTDIVNPASRARIGTIYNNMLLQAKEAYNLGVLNGPDYSILQEVITHPGSAKGFITSKKALDDQAAKLDEIMERVGQTVTSPTKQGDKPSAPSAPKGKIKFLGFE